MVHYKVAPHQSTLSESTYQLFLKCRDHNCALQSGTPHRSTQCELIHRNVLTCKEHDCESIKPHILQRP